MARILSGGGKITGGKTGLPGGNWRQSISRFTGKRVTQDVARKRGVRRLIARDPANALTDPSAILGFNNDGTVPNPTPISSPTIVRAPTTAPRGTGRPAQGATPSGVEKVVDRSTNRRIKKS